VIAKCGKRPCLCPSALREGQGVHLRNDCGIEPSAPVEGLIARDPPLILT
jgi:hypothetical protein